MICGRPVYNVPLLHNNVDQMLMGPKLINDVFPSVIEPVQVFTVT